MPDLIIDSKLPDNAVLCQIGTVALEWSWLESLANEFLVKICSADPGAMYVITQNTSNSTVMKWLCTLVEVKLSPPESRDVVLDLLKEIDLVREERNSVVHGLWRAGDHEGFAHANSLKWSRGEVIRDEMWSIADFDELIDHIRLLQGRMANVMIKMGFLSPIR